MDSIKMICRISAFVSILLCPSFIQASGLRISAAASISNGVKELCQLYKKSHGDLAIMTNFASSGALARQINQGAPADIYISANPKWMDFLIEQGRILTSSRKTLVYNSLVFVGRKEIVDMSMDKLPGLKLIAIGSPRSVPAGQYAEQAMTRAGIYPQLLKEGKLLMAKDVRQALIYADRGEVDGAFVYKSDARLADNAAILFAVPEKLYSRVSYPVALTVAAENNVEARGFYDFLFSPVAAGILGRYGFIAAEGN